MVTVCLVNLKRHCHENARTTIFLGETSIDIAVFEPIEHYDANPEYSNASVISEFMPYLQPAILLLERDGFRVEQNPFRNRDGEKFGNSLLLRISWV